MINFQSFPKSKPISLFDQSIIDIFTKHQTSILSTKSLKSNDVLAILEPDLTALGFDVDKPGLGGKVRVPVLYEINNKPVKSFDVDGWHKDERYVLEVEGAATMTNFRFLKDLFQTCVMDSIDNCMIAVRNDNIYRGKSNPDFQKVLDYIETIYVSNKLILPLEKVIVVGY